MSFSKQYAALEVKFKEQVKKDNEDFGLKSRFLANIAPKGPVDYVLIAMEPSLPANIDDIRNFTCKRRSDNVPRRRLDSLNAWRSKTVPPATFR